MSRRARQDVLYGGCYAHVISRSIRKLKLFQEDEDFKHAIKLFEMTKKRFGYRVHHYCLMHTHFHLVVSMPDVVAFSKAIQYLKSQYCVYFHQKYRLSGPIWRERYRALLIENDGYMRGCGEYVEANPVAAGLVQGPDNWKYSSWRHYYGDEADGIVDDGAEVLARTQRVDLEHKDRQFFEEGSAIGSSFFRFQLHEKLKRM